ncbi:MAG: hypothetical protein WBG32_08000 [Nodosilinea sp.]
MSDPQTSKTDKDASKPQPEKLSTLIREYSEPKDFDSLKGTSVSPPVRGGPTDADITALNTFLSEYASSFYDEIEEKVKALLNDQSPQSNELVSTATGTDIGIDFSTELSKLDEIDIRIRESHAVIRQLRKDTNQSLRDLESTIGEL